MKTGTKDPRDCCTLMYSTDPKKNAYARACAARRLKPAKCFMIVFGKKTYLNGQRDIEKAKAAGITVHYEGI